MQREAADRLWLFQPSIPQSLTNFALVVQVKLHVFLWKRHRIRLAGLYSSGVCMALPAYSTEIKSIWG